mgnify:CR=1 FL=1
MPIARRRRANPPEQPENNSHLADQLENATEALATEQSAESSQGVERQEQNQGQVVQNQLGQPSPVATPQASFNSFAAGQSPPALQASSTTPASQSSQGSPFPSVSQGSQVVPTSQVPQTPVMNGERIERQDYTSASTPGFEGGRRTARGELFRRPPQPPAPQPVPASVAGGSQTSVREISLPLGNLLHLAYNPGYTGSEEARRALLEQLEQESKTGGRARCWGCGSLGIVYDRWDIRSKAFSEVGIAFCEICGVWSVM